MKTLNDCKEYYKDLYMDCLDCGSFDESQQESTEKVRYTTLCDTLRFIYGAEFEKVVNGWNREALNEYYGK